MKCERQQRYSQRNPQRTLCVVVRRKVLIFYGWHVNALCAAPERSHRFMRSSAALSSRVNRA